MFVLENNKFAYSTPQELEFAVDPVERARGYGFTGVSVDGTEPFHWPTAARPFGL